MTNPYALFALILGTVVLMAIAHAPATVDIAVESAKQPSVLAPLEKAMTVQLIDMGPAWDIEILPQGTKGNCTVDDIGSDFVVLADATRSRLFRIPVYAIRTVMIRDPGKRTR